MKLTAAEITGVYDEIGSMRVDLDPDPNRGLQYVKERLTLCRAMQDRLGELLLQSSRALSAVLSEELALKMEKQLATTDSDQERQQREIRLTRVLSDKDEHATLLKMLRLQHTLLGRTSQDIRLLADLTKEQIKLGEIDPKEAGLVKDVPTEDLSPTPPVVSSTTSAPSEDVTLSPPLGIIEEMNVVVQTPVPFPGLPVLAGPEPVTDFDTLFGALNGEHSDVEHPGAG